MSAVAGGLFDGVLHPLLAPAQVLALIGLGIFIGRQSSGRLLGALAFAAGLVGGLVAIASAIGPTPAREILLVSAAVTGAAVALAIPLGPAGYAIFALIVGAAIGLDSAPEVVSLQVGSAILIGAGFGACLALAIVAGCAAMLVRDRQRIGLRVLGSWIAASAVLVLALRFAGP